MPDFSVVGSVDPFLHVSLKKGEAIYAERGAMVSMDTTLELKGEMRGGVFGALARSFTSGESFFQQTMVATNGDGDALFSPNLPGDVMVLECGARQFRLNDGAFLAAETSLEIKTKSQGIGQALFGGTGGFFIMETSGQGKLAIAGFGALFAMDVKPGSDTIVDNTHVVAWDAALSYQISASTAQRGFFSGLVNSMTSGEGMVNRFSGSGQVIVASRNKTSFAGWVASLMGQPQRG
jgi:uncharacterized protein (TIGR00266 family)